MDIGERDGLIDGYYRAVDTEAYDEFERLFTDDALHVRPGQGVLRGGAAVREHYEERRDATNTTHAVRERLHGDATSLCVLEVSGETPSGPFERPVVSEFTFDAGRLTAYRVYRGSTDDPRVTG